MTRTVYCPTVSSFFIFSKLISLLRLPITKIQADFFEPNREPKLLPTHYPLLLEPVEGSRYIK